MEANWLFKKQVFYQIFFKDSFKASATTLNLKETNINITKCSRIYNFEDTQGRWIDISTAHIVSLLKGASITLDLSNSLLRLRKLFIIFYYKTKNNNFQPID